jgi:signal transduction histidine kinase
LLLSALLLTSIKTNIWGKMGKLHEQFSNVKANAFYPTVKFMGHVRQLNDALLASHLQPNATNRERFRTEAETVGQQLGEMRRKAQSTELEALGKLEFAYAEYTKGPEWQLPAVNVPPTGEVFESLHKKLEDRIQPVLTAGEDLIKAQNRVFDRMVEESEDTLLHLQHLLLLSLILLWAFGLSVPLVGYRGMISPLRSRLKQSRSIIERQEKLASLGVLASGVAHEIRNPLTAIKFRLFSLNQAIPEVAEQEDAKVVSAEIDRLDRIVKDFLQFARPSDPKLIGLPAERILQKVHDLLKPGLEKQAIELRLESSGTTWVEADLQQLEQVLINLIQNSADSIGEEGVITLRVREGRALLAGQSRAVVILEVADTGKGIPAAVEKRLFDPFFTTKEGGTGLGLAIAARIIEKHGGMLRYKSRLYVGTTFKILLPKLEKNAS